MKRSVGIILRFGNDVLLQRRGFWNWEEQKPQSFSGLLQVTAHGGCRERESWTAALFREVREELGGVAERIVRQRHEKGEMVLVHELASEDKSIRTYGVRRSLGMRQLDQLRLEIQSGGLIPYPLASLDRLQAVQPSQKRDDLPVGWMFADEIAALRRYAELVLQV